jgi:uroporphyrinogen decarboxylase
MADARPKIIHQTSQPERISMKPRERVLTALNHEAPDRCPMQISFTPEFADRLRADMHLETGKIHNPHGGGNTYEMERALDEDLLLTSVGWANCYYQDADEYTDEWGVGWRTAEYTTPFGNGKYTEITGHPLAADNAISQYRAPDPNRPELYAESQWVLDTFKKDYFIVGVTVTTIFETAWALRGLERLLEDFALNPDIADAVLDIPYQYHLEAAKKLTRMGVDMIWTGDDVGGQHAMIISPKMWRRYLKPRMANFIAELKAINPQVKVAYHSDGQIYSIIPDLIEIGLDVLNPIQPASMDPVRLKQEYGDKLCFWGSIDEQQTLPFGSAADVEAEVHQRLQTLGKDGGLIIGPTHHVQLDTPIENLWALVNTVRSTPCQRS